MPDQPIHPFDRLLEVRRGCQIFGNICYPSEVGAPVTGLEPALLIGLAVLGFVAGVGVTARGPGGVLVTIGLFAFTSLSPAQIAGTAMVTNVATGVLAAAAYTRSGQLRAERFWAGSSHAHCQSAP
ncbi:hypothetical protein ABIA39_007147 [Nocardia sp. GAS34]|uniref:hypothetical protein n=1 Tax=unclassified Nocardia TaxID=2637762 RepID=UPI003D195F04